MVDEFQLIITTIKNTKYGAGIRSKQVLMAPKQENQLELDCVSMLIWTVININQEGNWLGNKNLLEQVRWYLKEHYRIGFC